MIFLRASEDGGAEFVARIGSDTFVYRIDLMALLALLETASRIALTAYRDEKADDT